MQRRSFFKALLGIAVLPAAATVARALPAPKKVASKGWTAEEIEQIDNIAREVFANSRVMVVRQHRGREVTLIEGRR
jgi:hypothetical protein